MKHQETGRSALRRRVEHYLGRQLIQGRLLPLWAKFVYRSHKRAVPSEVKSVLVWNQDALGDALWVTPALQALRQGFPKAYITLVCAPSNVAVFETNPNIDTRLMFLAGELTTVWGRVLMPPALREKRYDLMLILEMSAPAADTARRLGRRLDVGYMVSTDIGLLKHLPDYTLPPNTGARAEYWPLHFLRATQRLGLSPVSPSPQVFPAPEDLAAVEPDLAHWAQDGRRLVAFHPGAAHYAGSVTKKWPEAHYVQLAAHLAERQAVRIVLTGTEREREDNARLALGIRAAAPGVDVVLASCGLSVRQMFCLLRGMDAVVVADTGILHLAAASGTPTVGLFGPTDPALIAPKTENCRVLRAELPCAPCYVSRDRAPFWPRCIHAQQLCMESVTPQRVAEELLLLMNQVRAGRGAWTRQLPVLSQADFAGRV